MMRMHTGYRACGGTGIFPGPGRRHLGQRYSSPTSVVDSSPSRQKFFWSQASARARPTFIRWVRLSQSALSLSRGPNSVMTSAGVDAVDQHSLHRVVENLAVVDQLGDKSDRAHLVHQRGIEADLVDAVHDLGRGRRQFRPFEWIDMNDDDVAAVAPVNERKDRRISHVPAVPVMLAVNLDRLKHQRQAS